MLYSYFEKQYPRCLDGTQNTGNYGRQTFKEINKYIYVTYHFEFNEKGKVHGEMCVLHEDEDGDLVPLSIEKAQENIIEEEQSEIEKMLLN